MSLHCRHAAVEHVAIHAVMTAQPVGRFELGAAFEGSLRQLAAVLAVVRMDIVEPPLIAIVGHRAPDEIEPTVA